MDRLNDEALNDGPDDESDQRRDNKADPEIAGRRQAEPCQHGADHEEVAMGDIDDVQQTENNRKPERDERDDQSPDQPVHRQQKYRIPHDQPPTMAIAQIPVRHPPTFSTSAQEPRPTGAGPTDSNVGNTILARVRP